VALLAPLYDDAVEYEEPLLDSDCNDAIWSVEALVDRRRDDAVAVSNCCLVCWCMSLKRISVDIVRRWSFQGWLTFGMSTEQPLGPGDRSVVRSAPQRVRARRSRWECNAMMRFGQTWWWRWCGW
jgi:hypothetical protein